jgi:hypothetical protein
MTQGKIQGKLMSGIDLACSSRAGFITPASFVGPR